MTCSMEQDYRLRWMDFDKYGRIQPFALLDLCQDVATEHAEMINIGRSDMLAKGVFWAVIRTKLEIVGTPKHFQDVTVRTWPHSPTRFSFQRDFSIRDESGDELAKATTEWVLMDIETRKFVSAVDFYDVPDDLDDARAFERKPRKIKDFETGNMPVATFAPGYSDIDVNGHVNNAKYANYIVDALDAGPDASIRTLQIDYRHEVLPGAPLAMHTLVEDGIVRSKGIREDGAIAFASIIELA